MRPPASALPDSLALAQSADKVDVLLIGAGGGALHLLQASGIPEGQDYGGFPVGGSFLINGNPDVATLHLAKAYGKASVGSPPMSVPHLDPRVLGGKRVILFGPFATFSTKFLKEGSYFDLLTSTTTNDDPEMVAQAWAYTSEQLQLPAPPAIDRGPLKPTPVSDTVLNSSDTPVKGPVGDLAP